MNGPSVQNLKPPPPNHPVILFVYIERGSLSLSSSSSSSLDASLVCPQAPFSPSNLFSQISSIVSLGFLRLPSPTFSLFSPPISLRFDRGREGEERERIDAQRPSLVPQCHRYDASSFSCLIPRRLEQTDNQILKNGVSS